MKEGTSSSLTNSTAATRSPDTLRLVLVSVALSLEKAVAKSRKSERAQGFRFRQQGICSPTQRSGPSLMLAFRNSSLSVLHRPARSCWRFSSNLPPKGMTIPYWPKPSSSPVIFTGGQDRYSTGSNSASFPHTTLCMCLSPDLEGHL